MGHAWQNKTIATADNRETRQRQIRRHCHLRCAPAAPNGPKLSILQGFRGDREKGDDATENPENIVNMMKEGGSSSAKHLAIANELDYRAAADAQEEGGAGAAEERH